MVTSVADADDLGRDVYCILGMPIDALDMATVVRRIEAAAARAAPFLISTPNLNFLVSSRTDAEFRESVLGSDLCLADGMPIVWIARLLGIPIRIRVSGADIFDALQSSDRCGRRLKVFLFGGAPGVAAAAATKLNAGSDGLRCVGTFDPGFCAVAQMSGDDIIDKINASGADFLAASLGAQKGQSWLLRNHNRITVPVRAHLGAAINFQAEMVQRAPPKFRAAGFEWLWRIKEEPHLWRRYWHDGGVLLRLFLTRVLPLVVGKWSKQLKHLQQDLHIKTAQDQDSVMIALCGEATERNIGAATRRFRETLTAGSKVIVIDLSHTRVIDERFFGLLLMVRKQVKGRGGKLTFIGVTPVMKRMFRLHELGFLLSTSVRSE